MNCVYFSFILLAKPNSKRYITKMKRKNKLVSKQKNDGRGCISSTRLPSASLRFTIGSPTTKPHQNPKNPIAVAINQQALAVLLSPFLFSSSSPK